MIRLYRAVSQEEKHNFDRDHQFRTSERTLEVKQFFKSKTAVMDFVANSVLQNYDPPYAFLITIGIDEEVLGASNAEEILLDGFEAISINEQDLISFNNNITFVQEEVL